jgi:hypothetical protein
MKKASTIVNASYEFKTDLPQVIPARYRLHALTG